MTQTEEKITNESETSATLEQVIPLIREAAEKGNAEAMFRYGMLFANGEGLPLDYVSAAQWLQKAAEQGHAGAQRTLAWLYANGYGLTQSDEQALHWYTQAAEAGDLNAQYTLATIYQGGRLGVEADTKTMLHWYTQAANQGSATAQYVLGKLLAEGKRVQQNEEAAFQWLTLAVMGGSEPAKQELALLSAGLDQEQLEAFKQRMMAGLQGAGDG